MSKIVWLTAAIVFSICLGSPSRAEDIGSLKGQFAFNWHAEPSTQRCAAVDDALLAQFKSDAFSCEMTVVTNTASGEPARTCTHTGDGPEFLIFASEKSCELERTTQESNSE